MCTLRRAPTLSAGGQVREWEGTGEGVGRCEAGKCTYLVVVSVLVSSGGGDSCADSCDPLTTPRLHASGVCTLNGAVPRCCSSRPHVRRGFQLHKSYLHLRRRFLGHMYDQGLGKKHASGANMKENSLGSLSPLLYHHIVRHASPVPVQSHAPLNLVCVRCKRTYRIYTKYCTGGADFA